MDTELNHPYIYITGTLLTLAAIIPLLVMLIAGIYGLSFRWVVAAYLVGTSMMYYGRAIV